jgi:hypothetical protein
VTCSEEPCTTTDSIDTAATSWPGLACARPAAVSRVAATADLVVEVAGDGFCGAVTRVQSGTVELEDRRGRRRCSRSAADSSSTALPSS